jgi:DNA replication protein DnaC
MVMTMGRKMTMEKIDEIVNRIKAKQLQHKKPIGIVNQTDFQRSDNAITENELEKRGIFKRYQSITFAEIKRRGLPFGYDDIYMQVKNYADNMAENIQNGKGMILMGGYGTLKTTLAVAVLRQYLENGGSGKFVPMAALVDNLFTMREQNKAEWAAYEQAIRNTKLLVLDDLGAENTDQRWVLGKVDSIITERYNKMLPTIITTNSNAKDLLNTYSGRVYDRLRSTSEVIKFVGKSQREAV